MHVPSLRHCAAGGRAHCQKTVPHVLQLVVVEADCLWLLRFHLPANVSNIAPIATTLTPWSAAAAAAAVAAAAGVATFPAGAAGMRHASGSRLRTMPTLDYTWAALVRRETDAKTAKSLFVGMCPLRYISDPPLSISTYVSWRKLR